MPKILKIIIMIAIIFFVAIFYISTISGELHETRVSQIMTNNLKNHFANDSTNDSINDSKILANIATHKNLTYSLPDKPAYILRLDDVQTPAWSEASMRIINDTLRMNMSISVAVIPERDSPDKYGIVESLREHENNPRFEIVQHGFSHSYYEYANLSANETQLITMKGLRKLYQDYNMCPVTFIPPNNQISYNAYNALYSMGFKIVATEGNIRYEGNILDVGHNVATTAGTGGTLNSPKDVTSMCEKDFQKQNLSVIMIHPQDYVTNDKRTIDESKYATYLEILQRLNDTKAQSITFRDLLKGGETI